MPFFCSGCEIQREFVSGFGPLFGTSEMFTRVNMLASEVSELRDSQIVTHIFFALFVSMEPGGREARKPGSQEAHYGSVDSALSRTLKAGVMRGLC